MCVYTTNGQQSSSFSKLNNLCMYGLEVLDWGVNVCSNLAVAKVT